MTEHRLTRTSLLASKSFLLAPVSIWMNGVSSKPSLQPPHQQGTMETKTAVEMPVATMLTPAENLAQLPMVITEQVRKKGDLIDTANFTPEQIAAVKQIYEGFNLSNTGQVLMFAAKPQKDMSAFLNELMAGIRVKDAGLAGDISMQLAKGIDLMSLHKVKEQILNPPSSNLAARFFRWLFHLKNYLYAFYLSQTPIRSLVDEIERKANNRIVTLTANSEKLDQLAKRSVIQIRALEVWIAAGEQILVGAINQYLAEREKVLQTKDVVLASQLRDMARQLAAFEKRLLETKIAFVEAGSVTIPRIRAVQEASVIEIQNTSEQILFHLTKFKAGIVMIAALNDIASAQRERQVMDENERKLDATLDDVVRQVYVEAKKSQGSPLAKVEALIKTVDAVEAGINEGIRLESETRKMREQAEQLLVGIKDRISEALKKADIQSAEATPATA